MIRILLEDKEGVLYQDSEHSTPITSMGKHMVSESVGKSVQVSIYEMMIAENKSGKDLDIDIVIRERKDNANTK
jgi:hypothetical protein